MSNWKYFAGDNFELWKKSVQDACLSSTKVAKEFYHAARDALLLYKAIVPIKVCVWTDIAYAIILPGIFLLKTFDDLKSEYCSFSPSVFLELQWWKGYMIHVIILWTGKAILWFLFKSILVGRIADLFLTANLIAQ